MDYEQPKHQLTPPEDLPPVSLRNGTTTLFKVLTSLAILGAGSGAIGYFVVTKKMPVAESVTVELPAIAVAKVELGDFRPEILSQGIVEPISQTSAKAEVAGKVVWVSEKWHAGEDFAKDAVLLKLDAADYEAAVAQAKAREADASVALEMAEAKAEQAKRDWQKLNPGQKPENQLVLQEPQLAAAKTNLEAAKAAVAKAERDLERTQLKMPYAGRLQKTHVHLGTFVAPGAPVADFYSTQKYQIRLAVSPEDAAMLDFSKKAPVMLENSLTPDLPPIAATMERTEGEIDRHTRSLVIVAEFENANQLPGAYFKAKLPAKAYTQVKKLPRRCLREDSHLWSVSPARTLHKQTLTIVRREQDTIYFSGGPEPQTEVLASVLPATTEGMAVRLVEPKNGVHTAHP